MSKHFPLLTILFIAALVRTYHWHRPLADWHSWRQADTASVTRRYVQEGIDLLHPKYDDLSSIPSGLDNPQGYRMVEFPFYNAFIALLFNLTSGFNLEIHVFSRLIAILISLGSISFLYYLVRELYSSKTALLTSALFSLMPFWIFYSTTMLPEVPLVFLTISSSYWWIKYCLSLRYSHLWLFVITVALAMLLKPTFAFMVIPFAYYYFRTFGYSGFKKPAIFLAAVFSLIPFFLWRIWITQFPEGIPAYDWLLNSTHIRFTGAFFRWLFAERYGKLILGYWGILPFGIGILRQPSPKSGWFFHFWLVAVLLYLTIFATGNVTHDYYQVTTLPVIAVFAGIGFYHLMFEANFNFSRHLSRLLALSSLLFMLAFSWYHLRDFFNINNPAIVTAGTRVQQLTPPTAKIIAPYLGDTAFLYQTNRQGWPIGGDLDKKISMGATHYVTTTQDDEANQLLSLCQLVEQTDQFIIIDLQKCIK